MVSLLDPGGVATRRAGTLLSYIFEYIAHVRGFSRNAKLFIWSSTLSALASGVVFVIMNLYLVRVGLQENFLGMLVFYSSIAGVVFALPAGQASDRFGRRGPLMVSGGVAAAGILAQVMFPSPTMLVVATLLTGAAFTVGMVAGGPLMVESSDAHERTHLFGFQAALSMGISVIGSNLGGLLPKLFGALLGTGADTVPALKATLLVGVALFVLAVLPLVPMREERRSIASVRTAGSSWLRLTNRAIVARLVVPQAIIGLGAGFIMPLQNVFLNRYLGASTAQIGLIFAVSSAVTGTATLASPLLANRWGKVRSIAASQLASLPFLAVMGLVPHLWAYAVASWIRTSLMNLVNPIISNFSLEVVQQQERATVNSLINMTWNLGWAVSGWAGGWIMQNVSYTLPYGCTFVLYVVGILTFYHFFKAYDPPLPVGERSGSRGRPAPSRAPLAAGKSLDGGNNSQGM